MPLGGVRSSPLPRPRNERRESRLRRSSWVRKAAESSSWPARTVATPLFLIQRLEVLLDLTLEVARHLLPRDGLFHHLPVLPDHAHVLQTRRHLGAAPHHLGVDALPPPGARLALDSHVARAAAEPRGGVALRRPALAAPGQEALALRKVALVPRPAGLPAALVAALAAAALALPPALQPLAVAAALFHRAHLVERALHRFHRLFGLPALERLHALVGVARPVALPLPAVLRPEPLHLAQQLAQLLRPDLLVRVGPAPQRLGLLEDHAGLALGEVALQIRQPLERIEHAQPLVALLEERVEVGRAPAQPGVLEHHGQAAALAMPPPAQARAQIALLHVGALHLVAPGGLLALRLLGLATAVHRRLLLVLLAGDREVGATALGGRDRGSGREHGPGQRRDPPRPHRPPDSPLHRC